MFLRMVHMGCSSYWIFLRIVHVGWSSQWTFLRMVHVGWSSYWTFLRMVYEGCSSDIMGRHCQHKGRDQQTLTDIRTEGGRERHRWTGDEWNRCDKKSTQINCVFFACKCTHWPSANSQGTCGWNALYSSSVGMVSAPLNDRLTGINMGSVGTVLL